jgi:CheY-like chemotaxis protein
VEIFTNLGMAEMNGWELCRAVRQRKSNIAVAVITAWGDAANSQECQAAHVDWVVTKPFESRQIVEIIRDVLRLRSATSCGELTIVAA